jgi:hypothetical protein
MKTCKTCKHWTEVPAQYYAGFDRECVSQKFTEGSPNEGEADCLTYSYYEGGSFHPGPDFGCVHHESTDGCEDESGDLDLRLADELLAFAEDSAHGDIGNAITRARSVIGRVIRQLPQKG